ncbi:MAG: hypothetical protein DRR19_10460 [Candidatus Parabeggiatoa sp. nov. 1]|nr:MAG: hypothetical protein DRR19_10460 [Gammaproteobacteria bacterium]
MEPLPFKTGINPSETVHSVFEFKVPSDMAGEYTFYALYVQKSSNPLVVPTVLRDNATLNSIAAKRS